MELSKFIIRGLHYDRWANRQWINSMGGFKNLQRAQEILEHIYQAQQIWLDRFGVKVEMEKADMALTELFDMSIRAWIEVIETSDVDEVVEYQNSRGEEFAQPLSQIALHVINHGTYHRGQLRGLAEADGFYNFPETDLILFLREQRD